MNCKPGDLAIVIKAWQTPELVGMIVQVLRPAVDGEKFEGHRFARQSHVFSWVVESIGRPIPTRTLSGKLLFARQRVIADQLLRPVSGLPDTEDTDTEQPIKEVA